MKRTISIVLVLALGLAAEVANADFVFVTPTNLGPTVNHSRWDANPCISPDGLSLYFHVLWPGSEYEDDIWVSTRKTVDDDWGDPVNVGLPVNSEYGDGSSCISADGLSLYFESDRPGGSGRFDLWSSTRATTEDPWGEPVNLGPKVNSGSEDWSPEISADRLCLFFGSWRSGELDIYMTTRDTTADEWGTSVNLGPNVNSLANDTHPEISPNGLILFFSSTRPGGSGGLDLWMTTRATIDSDWRTPVNLGPTVNSSAEDGGPSISANGSTLYFCSNRPGGFGNNDLWQVPIEPIVDLNGDGIVDSADICIIVDHWGTDDPLCDIGPTPFGDGIVDVQDLIVLAEHLFEGIPPVELEEVNVDEDDTDSQVELEQGQILVVTLESNPTTGYRWEQVEIQESVLQQMGEAEFKPSQTGEPPLVGAGGWEIFRFKALSAGQTSLKLVYHRTWEEGVEPLKTFSIQVVVN